jgi:hypothetical protein
VLARFFNPWVGDDYWDGMGGNEYCVLVLGASAYCSSRNCPHFDECTSEDNQDSSAFNDQCPHAEIDSDIVLGLIMGNAFEQWKNGR